MTGRSGRAVENATQDPERRVRRPSEIRNTCRPRRGSSAEKYPSFSASTVNGWQNPGFACCQSPSGKSRQRTTSTVLRLGAQTRKLTPLPATISAPTTNLRQKGGACRTPLSSREEWICERLKERPTFRLLTRPTAAAASRRHAIPVRLARSVPSWRVAFWAARAGDRHRQTTKRDFRRIEDKNATSKGLVARRDVW